MRPDLSSLAEHAPSPMAVVEGSTHVLRYVNPAFCRLVQLPAEQLLGKSFCDIVRDEADCVTLLDRVYHSGRSESHIEQRDGGPRPFAWSYSIWPVVSQGQPAAVIIQVTETGRFRTDMVAMNEALLLGSVRQHELTEAADASNIQLNEEIKERIHAENELHRSQEQLADRAGQLEGLVTERTSELTSTNQQLEAFAYSIAHDLRAPLRAMQGFSALLVEEAGTALSEAGKRYADRISKAAQLMDAMLSDLLEFSRISQQQVELSSVNLGTVVESVLSQLKESIAEQGARVDSSGPWPHALAHEPTLTQVLFNLTSNALKFVRPGVPLLLRLRAEERAEVVRVWVEDNGVGIEPNYQGQIFRLFTRLNGEKYPGTGIGLAIVEKGVERLGGRVGVDSVLHQGSRFWFELRKAA